MKSKNSALTLTLAIAVMTSWTAAAQGRGGGGGRGQQPPTPAIDSALDADGDQMISADEIADAASILGNLDTDSDGSLSFDECMGFSPNGNSEQASPVGVADRVDSRPRRRSFPPSTPAVMRSSTSMRSPVLRRPCSTSTQTATASSSPTSTRIGRRANESEAAHGECDVIPLGAADIANHGVHSTEPHGSSFVEHLAARATKRPAIGSLPSLTISVKTAPSAG